VIEDITDLLDESSVDEKEYYTTSLIHKPNLKLSDIHLEKFTPLVFNTYLTFMRTWTNNIMASILLIDPDTVYNNAA
jgi:hypothetical protein